MKKGLVAWIILFCCNLMWASQFTCIKLVQDQVGPYATVWGPMLISSIFLAPFVIKDFRKGKKRLKDVLIFLQLAALGAFPSQVLMTWGTQKSSASNAAILVLVLPVITVVFAFLMLKERMNRLRWISFAVAIIGVILCSTDDIHKMNMGSQYAVGNLLIFLALVGNAYYNVGCKKIANHYTEMEMVFYTYLFMVILLLPFVLYYERDVFARIPHFTETTWIGLSALTIFHNFLSMILFFKVLKYLDATQVALSNYLITFLGLPIAAILLKERLNLQVIIGGLLVLTSTLILTIVDHRTNTKNATQINL
jgi:drug/metabolite transporter (DMT)-like permease